ncbi:cytochrome P450 4C1-like [Anopheles aquasalis]|uniref:cytochrome P450 4C1-like n=1 Tax=Anopheles aquasalis TaxID=42839 RepID=UPI00215AA56A|nr:cytochrome P450 4C1-like [Anopheles aquasalis]
MEPLTVTTLVLLILCFPLLRWLLERHRLAQIYDRIPGPRAYPFVGTLYMFFGKTSEEISTLIDRRVSRYDGIHRIWVGMTPEVRLSKPEYIEQIISSSKHIEKGTLYRFLADWLGDGLLTAKGERWFQHRKLITPTFHFNILDGFCEVFAESTAVLVKRLQPYAATGRPINIYPFITNAALDIICETAMGVKVNAQGSDGADNSYVSAVYGLSSLFLERLVRPWLHPEWIFKRSALGRKQQTLLDVLHGYTRQVIQERKKALDAGATVHEVPSDGAVYGRKRRLAFLDLLLQSASNTDTNPLSDEDVREEVDTFMFEGHDTTTAGMSWALFLLSLHPEIQEQVHQEIDSIFNGSDRPATMQDLNEMRLLERCLKETLRLYPSVPFFGRTTSDDVNLGGYHVPARTIIGIHTYNVHRDERYFPEPERFDPDRFLAERSEGRHPYAYIPFSAGPRNCIGQKFALLEEKSVVSGILRRYRIRSARTREQQQKVAELITRPKDGVLLYLESRTTG